MRIKQKWQDTRLRLRAWLARHGFEKPGRMRLGLWTAGLAALMICGSLAAFGQEAASDATQPAAGANIDLRGTWARATPGKTENAAIYLDIVNSGATADTLTGVECNAAEKAELHETTSMNGMSGMQMTVKVAIPAGGTVQLKPGGRHVMLTGLKGPLKEGESFIITLDFAKAGRQSTTVQVLSASATGPKPAEAAN
jgi:copper(I)-binding protein